MLPLQIPLTKYNRKNILVQSPIARHAPRADEEDSEHHHDGIGTHRAGEHEIKVHREAEERREPRETADNQTNTYGNFTERDEVRPKLRIWLDESLKERRVPALDVGMTYCRRRRARVGRFLEGVLDKAADALADVVAYPCGIVELTPSCL